MGNVITSRKIEQVDIFCDFLSIEIQHNGSEVTITSRYIEGRDRRLSLTSEEFDQLYYGIKLIRENMSLTNG